MELINYFLSYIYIGNIIDLTDLSLKCFYINFIDFSFFRKSYFEFSFFFDLVFNNVFQYYGIITVLLIYYFLFKNLFLYSLHYYLIQFLFSYKYNIAFSSRNTYIDALLTLLVSRWPYNIIFWIADNMFISTILILLLLFYNMYSINLLSFFSIENSLTNIIFPYIINFNLIKWIPYLFDFIQFGLIIDNLSLLMIIIVLSISTLVHYYSIDYMYSDPRLITFLKYLSGFTAAMLILVTANNCVLLFMGWEGVGIFSYLLIGFWYTWTLALKASLKAVIVNKIGDIALLIAIGLLLFYFGTVDFTKLNFLVNYVLENKFETLIVDFGVLKVNVLTLIALFLFIGAAGKSAQFGLHTWLPDAMEGPTPVSALIHAATMVTAGVYLIVWTSFIFEQAEFVWNIILYIGGLTAFYGSCVAACQFDMKKIIAFSTCSQIGYMFIACGLSAYNLAMFHLFTHAFFKALLFLCAGSIIHSLWDQQDVWKMGDTYRYFPITYAGMVIGLFSLMGFPFTSGFYSKDTIIELAFCKNSWMGFYSFFCAWIGACVTAFYSAWILYFIFFAQAKFAKHIMENIKETGTYILSIITILSILTIFVGFFFKHALSSPFSYIYFLSSTSVNVDNFIFAQYEYYLSFDFGDIWYSCGSLFFFFLSAYVKKILFVFPITTFIVSMGWFKYYGWVSFQFISDYVLKMERESDDMWHHYSKHYGYRCDVRYLVKLFYSVNSLEARGHIDYIYNIFVVKPLLKLSYYICYIELDRGWLEYVLVKFPTQKIFFFSKSINQSFSNPTLMFLPSMLLILLLLISYIIIFAIANII